MCQSQRETKRRFIMANRIKCAECKFTHANKELSSRRWTAYTCGNHKSEYHKTVLNVTNDGRQVKDIVWIGCYHGERQVG